MTLFALGLVLASAVTHASWNLFAKRAGGGAIFTWLFSAAAVALYAPLTAGLVIFQQPGIGATQLVFIAGSAILHLVYFLLLAGGYRAGDLSLVYPLARGTGPLLATSAAIAFLGERPTTVALIGACLIGVGIFGLAGEPSKLRSKGAGRAVAYALLTGLLICGYTLWDKQAVGAAGIPPLLYLWGFTLGMVIMMTPYVWSHRETVAAEWTHHRSEVLVIAVLMPLSYILFLPALALSPVSYVAPMREIGILVGAAMGTRLLAEGHSTRRLASAGAMVAGVIGLAVG